MIEEVRQKALSLSFENLKLESSIQSLKAQLKAYKLNCNLLRFFLIIICIKIISRLET